MCNLSLGFGSTITLFNATAFSLAFNFTASSESALICSILFWSPLLFSPADSTKRQNKAQKKREIERSRLNVNNTEWVSEDVFKRVDYENLFRGEDTGVILIVEDEKRALDEGTLEHLGRRLAVLFKAKYIQIAGENKLFGNRECNTEVVCLDMGDGFLRVSEELLLASYNRRIRRS